MTDFSTATTSALSETLQRKELSSVELTRYFLDKIEAEKALNAFVTLCPETALTAAQASDRRRAKGESLGVFDGIPYAAKDVFCTRGIASTACSRILEGFIPPYESTVTAKLRDAGAVMLGKTNMDEFAMGSSNDNSAYGRCYNPHKAHGETERRRSPGGSSGGSAAAVAAGLAPAALGSDTGGSVRQPASFCGAVGVKPGYGRCSRYGMIAYASSLDQAGVFARSVEDAALWLQAICGHDPKDSTSWTGPVEHFGAFLGASLEGKRVGLPKEYRVEHLPAEAVELWNRTADALRDAGAHVQEISLSATKYALPAYYILAAAEASANLARYDGVRYGKRSQNTKSGTLEEAYVLARSEGFGPEVKRRLMLGTYALSAGYYDAYYTKAQKTRALVAQDFANAFRQVDVILAPVTPTPAFEIDARMDPTMMYMNDVFTVPASLAGLPAISIPAGTSKEGLPLGMQLIAPPFQEAELFRFAYAAENR